VLSWWGGPVPLAGAGLGPRARWPGLAGRPVSCTGFATPGGLPSAWGGPPRCWTPPRTALALRAGGCCSARPSFGFSGTTVMDRWPRAGRRAEGPGWPDRERLEITMNVSARSETEVEVGRGDHFSHDA
jgi:hypothetical protein